ncbi:MAG: nickel/cobalt transporter [Bacteroidota bacterium]|nr:nickel/cobalt transporter [Kiloniellaceae bacterium]
MRLLAAALLCLAFLFCFAPAPGGGAAAQTPFVAPGGEAASAASDSLWQRGLGWLHDTQRGLHRQLAAAVRGLKEGGAGATALLIGLSLLYGVFHAAGPGHGKAVISAYLLANEKAVRRGVLLAFLASLVQALSALLLVGVLAVVLDMAGVAVRDSVGVLESASYLLVAAVGLWLLAGMLRRPRPAPAHPHSTGHAASHPHDHDHGHNHGHTCGHNHLPDPALLDSSASQGQGFIGKAGALVLAVGIRPCSGAVLVLLFALAQGVFLAGVAATFAMALGTAVTVSALAVLTLFSKRLALAAVGARQHWVEAAYSGLGLFGAAALFLLGAALFWASLAPGGPL